MEEKPIVLSTHPAPARLGALHPTSFTLQSAGVSRLPGGKRCAPSHTARVLRGQRSLS